MEPNTYTQCPKVRPEDLLLIVVPKAHHVTTLNGCHKDAGHQGCMLYLVLVMGALLVTRNG